MDVIRGAALFIRKISENLFPKRAQIGKFCVKQTLVACKVVDMCYTGSVYRPRMQSRTMAGPNSKIRRKILL